MDLLIVRHAHAGDAAFKEKWRESGRPDSARPLSKKGRKTMKEAARGLRKTVPGIDVLASSTLTRAEQTADILDKAYGGLERVTTSDLAPPATSERTILWLKGRQENTVAIIGHEPQLSRLIGRLLAGVDASFVTLKKGQACLIAFEGAPAAGKGRLEWSLSPRHLKRIA